MKTRSTIAGIAAIALAALTVPAAVHIERWRDAEAARPSEVVSATLVPPPNVPPPVNRTRPATVAVDLETTEQKGVLASGVEYTFWTFNGTVPGPLVCVRAGDTVRLRCTSTTARRPTSRCTSPTACTA